MATHYVQEYMRWVFPFHELAELEEALARHRRFGRLSVGTAVASLLMRCSDSSLEQLITATMAALGEGGPVSDAVDDDDMPIFIPLDIRTVATDLNGGLASYERVDTVGALKKNIQRLLDGGGEHQSALSMEWDFALKYFDEEKGELVKPHATVLLDDRRLKGKRLWAEPVKLV